MSSYQTIFQTHLELPAFDYKCKQIQERTLIWDVVRKKYIVLTPEEWVRQHLIHYLISHVHFPKGMLSVEKEIKAFGLKKRYDIVIHDQVGAPLVLVECKAPHISLNDNVLHQILIYNSGMQVSRLIVSNGLKTYYLWFEGKTWHKSENIPEYEAIR